MVLNAATQTTPPATSPVTPSATTPICANGTTYSTCGSACPLTCENRDSPPIFCPQVCVSGCFCPSGMAAYQDACYLPSDCPTTGINYCIVTFLKYDIDIQRE